MKKYKVDNINKILIQEEVIESPIGDIDNKIKKLEREIMSCEERIYRYTQDKTEYEAELKELKKLAGDIKNV